MKKMYKAMLLVLCAVLLVAGSVMGTLAYLQMQTGTVTNTFTVGKVEITLDEARTNEYGEKDGDNRITVTADPTEGNKYKLVPGRTYTKDPTVTVKAGSEACYVFVKVNNEIAAFEADTNKIASQIVSIKNGWTALNGVENVFYKKIDAATTTDTPHVVFESFTIANNANEKTGWGSNHEIEITAYAIQAHGLADANAAWLAGGFGTNP